jgi:hypothetical protein
VLEKHCKREGFFFLVPQCLPGRFLQYARLLQNFIPAVNGSQQLGNFYAEPLVRHALMNTFPRNLRGRTSVNFQRAHFQQVLLVTFIIQLSMATSSQKGFISALRIKEWELLLVCSILSQGVMAAIYQLILFGMN